MIHAGNNIYFNHYVLLFDAEWLKNKSCFYLCIRSNKVWQVCFTLWK